MRAPQPPRASLRLHRPTEQKFLVDKRGAPVKRYTSDMAYHDLELDVYNELVRL